MEFSVDFGIKLFLNIAFKHARLPPVSVDTYLFKFTFFSSNF